MKKLYFFENATVVSISERFLTIFRRSIFLFLLPVLLGGAPKMRAAAITDTLIMGIEQIVLTKAKVDSILAQPAPFAGRMKFRMWMCIPPSVSQPGIGSAMIGIKVSDLTIANFYSNNPSNGMNSFTGDNDVFLYAGGVIINGNGTTAATTILTGASTLAGWNTTPYQRLNITSSGTIPISTTTAPLPININYTKTCNISAFAYVPVRLLNANDFVYSIDTAPYTTPATTPGYPYPSFLFNLNDGWGAYTPVKNGANNNNFFSNNLAYVKFVSGGLTIIKAPNAKLTALDTACPGTDFRVTADISYAGNDAVGAYTYQWQYSKDGTNWKVLSAPATPGAYANARSGKYTITGGKQVGSTKNKTDTLIIKDIQATDSLYVRIVTSSTEAKDTTKIQIKVPALLNSMQIQVLNSSNSPIANSADPQPISISSGALISLVKDPAGGVSSAFPGAYSLRYKARQLSGTTWDSIPLATPPSNASEIPENALLTFNFTPPYTDGYVFRGELTYFPKYQCKIMITDSVILVSPFVVKQKIRPVCEESMETYVDVTFKNPSGKSLDSIYWYYGNAVPATEAGFNSSGLTVTRMSLDTILGRATFKVTGITVAHDEGTLLCAMRAGGSGAYTTMLATDATSFFDTIMKVWYRGDEHLDFYLDGSFVNASTLPMTCEALQNHYYGGAYQVKLTSPTTGGGESGAAIKTVWYLGVNGGNFVKVDSGGTFSTYNGLFDKVNKIYAVVERTSGPGVCPFTSDTLCVIPDTTKFMVPIVPFYQDIEANTAAPACNKKLVFDLPIPSSMLSKYSTKNLEVVWLLLEAEQDGMSYELGNKKHMISGAFDANGTVIEDALLSTNIITINNQSTGEFRLVFTDVENFSWNGSSLVLPDITDRTFYVMAFLVDADAFIGEIQDGSFNFYGVPEGILSDPSGGGGFFTLVEMGVNNVTNLDSVPDPDLGIASFSSTSAVSSLSLANKGDTYSLFRYKLTNLPDITNATAGYQYTYTGALTARGANDIADTTILKMTGTENISNYVSTFRVRDSVNTDYWIEYSYPNVPNCLAKTSAISHVIVPGGDSIGHIFKDTMICGPSGAATIQASTGMNAISNIFQIKNAKNGGVWTDLNSFTTFPYMSVVVNSSNALVSTAKKDTNYIRMVGRFTSGRSETSNIVRVWFEPLPARAKFTATTDTLKCYNSGNFRMKVTPVGTGYKSNWYLNTSTTPMYSNSDSCLLSSGAPQVAGGTYAIHVKVFNDTTGCSSDTVKNIKIALVPKANPSQEFLNDTCTTMPEQLKASGTGGSGPYGYQWKNSGGTDLIEGTGGLTGTKTNTLNIASLASATYKVIVRDSSTALACPSPDSSIVVKWKVCAASAVAVNNKNICRNDTTPNWVVFKGTSGAVDHWEVSTTSSTGSFTPVGAGYTISSNKDTLYIGNTILKSLDTFYYRAVYNTSVNSTADSLMIKPVPVITGLTVSNKSICAGSSTVFTPTVTPTTGTTAKYTWNTSGGGLNNAAGTLPTHTYTPAATGVSGWDTVRVNVTIVATGCSAIFKGDTLRVWPKPTAPTTITLNPDGLACANLNQVIKVSPIVAGDSVFYFTSGVLIGKTKSSATVDSITWQPQSTDHNKTIKVVVKNNSGCFSDSSSPKTITVNPSVKPKFTTVDSTPCPLATIKVYTDVNATLQKYSETVPVWTTLTSGTGLVGAPPTYSYVVPATDTVFKLRAFATGSACADTSDIKIINVSRTPTNGGALTVTKMRDTLCMPQGTTTPVNIALTASGSDAKYVRFAWGLTKIAITNNSNNQAVTTTNTYTFPFTNVTGWRYFRVEARHDTNCTTASAYSNIDSVYLSKPSTPTLSTIADVCNGKTSKLKITVTPALLATDTVFYFKNGTLITPIGYSTNKADTLIWTPAFADSGKTIRTIVKNSAGCVSDSSNGEKIKVVNLIKATFVKSTDTTQCPLSVVNLNLRNTGSTAMIFQRRKDIFSPWSPLTPIPTGPAPNYTYTLQSTDSFFQIRAYSTAFCVDTSDPKGVNVVSKPTIPSAIKIMVGGNPADSVCFADMPTTGYQISWTGGNGAYVRFSHFFVGTGTWDPFGPHYPVSPPATRTNTATVGVAGIWHYHRVESRNDSTCTGPEASAYSIDSIFIVDTSWGGQACKGDHSTKDSVCENWTGGIDMYLTAFPKGTATKWYSSTDGVDYSTVVSSTSSFTIKPTHVTAQDMYYRAEVQSGICPSKYSQPFMLHVDSLSIGGKLLPKDTAFCFNKVNFTYAVTNKRGKDSIFQRAPEVSPGVPGVFGASAVSLTPATNTTVATYYYRMWVKNGRCKAVLSDTAKLLVKDTLGKTTFNFDRKVTCQDSTIRVSVSGTRGALKKWGYRRIQLPATPANITWLPGPFTPGDTTLYPITISDSGSYIIYIYLDNGICAARIDSTKDTLRYNLRPTSGDFYPKKTDTTCKDIVAKIRNENAEGRIQYGKTLSDFSLVKPGIKLPNYDVLMGTLVSDSITNYYFRIMYPMPGCDTMYSDIFTYVALAQAKFSGRTINEAGSLYGNLCEKSTVTYQLESDCSYRGFFGWEYKTANGNFDTIPGKQDIRASSNPRIVMPCANLKVDSTYTFRIRAYFPPKDSLKGCSSDTITFPTVKVWPLPTGGKITPKDTTVCYGGTPVQAKITNDTNATKYIWSVRDSATGGWTNITVGDSTSKTSAATAAAAVGVSTTLLRAILINPGCTQNTPIGAPPCTYQDWGKVSDTARFHIAPSLPAPTQDATVTICEKDSTTITFANVKGDTLYIRNGAKWIDTIPVNALPASKKYPVLKNGGVNISDTFYAVLRQNGVLGSCAVSSPTVLKIVKINPHLVAGSLRNLTNTKDSTITQGTTTGTMTLSGSTTTAQTNSTVTRTWQLTKVNTTTPNPWDFSSPVSGGGVTNTYSTIPTLDTLYFRVKTSDGICPDVYSDTIRFVIKPANKAIIAGGDPICQTANSFGTLTASFGAGVPSPSPTNTVQWLRSYSADNTTWGAWTTVGAIGTATTMTTEPGSNPAVGYYKYKIAYKYNTGATNDTSMESSVLRVDSVSKGGKIIPNSDTVCVAGSPDAFILKGFKGTSFTWSFSKNKTSWGAITNHAVVNDTTYPIPAGGALLADSGYYRVAVTNGACPAVYSDTAYLMVTPNAKGGNLSTPNNPECQNTNFVITLKNHVGNVLKWQSSPAGTNTWTDIANTNTTYTANIKKATDFRAVVATLGCGVDTYSDTLKMTVKDTIAITLQPHDTTVVASASASFTATYTADQCTTKNYKWEVSTNGGTSWSPCSGGDYTGVTSSTLVVLSAGHTEPTKINYKYRCILETECEKDTTVVVKVLHKGAFNPGVVVAQCGFYDYDKDTGTLTKAYVSGATGDGLQYEWFVNDAKVAANKFGTVGGNILADPNTTPRPTYKSGQSTDTLRYSVTKDLVDAGNVKFYVVVKDAFGSIDTINASVKCYDSLPSIDPKIAFKDTAVCEGATVKIAVDPHAIGFASGGSIAYQWQVSTGGAFSPCSGGAYSGITTKELTITMGAAMNGYKYRCMLTPTHSYTLPGRASDTLTVSVKANPAITVAPTNDTVCEGKTATFNVTATGGAPLAYKWEFWDNSVPQYDSVGNGNSFVISPAQKADNGKQFRVTVSNGCTPAISPAVFLTVKDTAVFSPLTDQTICESDTTSFAIQVTAGDNLKYSWKKDGTAISNTAVYSGQGTATLKISGAPVSAAGTYSCDITDYCNTVRTVSAVLTVNPKAKITSCTHPIEVAEGASGSFTVGASNAAQYAWCSHGKDSTNAPTPQPGSTNTLAVTVASGQGTTMDSTWYSCRVSGNCGRDTTVFMMLKVSFSIAFDLNLEPDTTICKLEDSLKLEVHAVIPTGDPITYKWFSKKPTDVGYTQINIGGIYTRLDSVFVAKPVSSLTDGMSFIVRAYVASTQDSAESGPMTLHLTQSLGISSVPDSQILVTPYNTAYPINGTITIKTDSGDLVSFDWEEFDGTDYQFLEAGNIVTLQKSDCALADTGLYKYRAVASSGCGKDTAYMKIRVVEKLNIDTVHVLGPVDTAFPFNNTNAEYSICENETLKIYSHLNAAGQYAGTQYEFLVSDTKNGVYKPYNASGVICTICTQVVDTLVVNPTRAMNGKYFKIIAKNPYDPRANDTSAGFKLNVFYFPTSYGVHPTPFSIIEGDPVTFNMHSSDKNGSFKYVWAIDTVDWDGSHLDIVKMADNDSLWNLATTVAEEHDRMRVFCHLVSNDGCGEIAPKDTFIRVAPNIHIFIDTTDPRIVMENGIAIMKLCADNKTSKITASYDNSMGMPQTWQWQVNKGSGWTNITASPFSGYDSYDLDFIYTADMAGWLFRCIGYGKDPNLIKDTTKPIVKLETAGVMTDMDINVWSAGAIVRDISRAKICEIDTLTRFVAAAEDATTWEWELLTPGGASVTNTLSTPTNEREFRIRWTEVEGLGLTAEHFAGYKVTCKVTNDCDDTLAEKEIKIRELLPFDVNIKMDSLFCFGSTIRFWTDTTDNSISEGEYAWTIDGTEIIRNPEMVAGPELGADADPLVVGDRTISVTVSPSTASELYCQLSDPQTKSVNIHINPVPVVTVTARDHIIIEGDTTVLSSSVTGGVAPYSIHWLPGTLVVDSTVESTATVPLTQKKTYVFTAIYTDSNNCSGSGKDSVKVIANFVLDSFIVKTTIVYPNGNVDTVVDTVLRPNDTLMICPGQILWLTPKTTGGNPPLRYTWNPEQPDYPVGYKPEYTADSTFGFMVNGNPGTVKEYYVQIFDHGDNEVHGAIFVKLREKPFVQLHVAPRMRYDKYFEGQAVYFHATPAIYPEYRFFKYIDEHRDIAPDTASGSNVFSTDFTHEGFTQPDATLDSNYTIVYVKDIYGCTGTDSVRIAITPVPSVILNEDKSDVLGTNINRILLPDFDIEVYDSWGMQIKPFGKHGWDGMYKGKAVKSGTYYYRARIPTLDGTIELKGAITVVPVEGELK